MGKKKFGKTHLRGSERQGQKCPEVSRKRTPEAITSSGRISSRVKIAILLALAGIGLGVGGYLVSSGKNDKGKQADLPKKSSSYVAPSGGSNSDGLLDNPLEREQLTAQLIQRIETSFVNWEQKLMPLIDSLEDKGLGMELKAPFEIVKINKGNPDKNYPEFERRMANTNTAALGRPYFFEYDARAIPGDANFVAGYSPAEARMFLSPSFNPDDPIDFIVLFHELKHVATDSNVRLGMKSEDAQRAYMDFYASGVKRMIINDEVGAYAFELEIFNMLLGGELKSAAEHGISLDPETVCQKLRSSDENLEVIEMLISLSREYFPHGLAGGVPNKGFFDLIAGMYRSRGYELYIHTSEGGLKRY